MKQKRTIEEILKSWGERSEKVPPQNDLLKSEILKKVPVSLKEFTGVKRNPLIVLPFAFTAFALFALIINLNISKHGVALVPTIPAGNEVSTLSEPAADSKISGESAGRSMESGQNQPSTFSLGAPAPTLMNGAYNTDQIMPAQPYQKSAPISDNREFLKINYNAALETRQVTKTETNLETIIRGFGGRVDSVSSGEETGYINFSIPKNNFEAFKLAVKDLVGERFYEEQLSSENFLPQKQAIEANERGTQASLDNLKAERATLVKNHNQIISSYTYSLNVFKTKRTALNEEYQNDPSPSRQIEIRNELREVQNEINKIELAMTQENARYNSRLSQTDTSIKYAESDLSSIKTQDKNLVDDVATVDGTITLKGINIFEFADAYVPGPLLTWIFVILALASYIWYRRSMRIDYEF